MNNPFKVGDKVMRREEWCIYSFAGHEHTVFTVECVGRSWGEHVVWLDNEPNPEYNDGWLPHRMRAAIAGRDYDVPDYDVPAQPNTGHLPDGSSVQKHSAGPIYPCVITLRDKRLKGTGLFDYGITSPRNPEPAWLSTLEAAYAVADIINKDIAQ